MNVFSTRRSPYILDQRSGNAQDAAVILTPSYHTKSTLVIWTNRGLEALWLLTIVLVPLVFVPRGYVLSEATIDFLELPKVALLRTLAALMAILWLIEWGSQRRPSTEHLIGGARPGFRLDAWLSGMGGWLRCRPTRWIYLAVWAYLGTAIVSTVLSASFEVSMWGEVPGQDGSATYTTLAYVIVFGVIATHLKTPSQLWRLVGAVVCVGVLVGGGALLQHYGYDFFGLKAPIMQDRASSTVGNPILAAAVLLMTIPISLVAATVTLRRPIGSAAFWGTVALWVPMLAIQLLGIVFTFSRGPWIGTVFALTGALALFAIFVSRGVLARAMLVLALSVTLTWVVMSIRVDTNKVDTNFADSSVTITPRAAAPVARRFASTGPAVAGGGISGRLEYWKGSGRLMARHPWFGFDSLSLPWLRPLIGYGPDFFRYTYMLESPTMGGRQMPLEPRHAHNYFVHQGVEMGFLGVITSLGIFGALLLVGAYKLLWERHRYSTVANLVLVGLVATFAGRLLEQTVGVARVSDLTISWVLLATFVSLPVVMANGQPVTETAPRLPPGGAARSGRHSPVAQTASDWQFLFRLVVVSLLIAGIGTLTVIKAWSYPWAGSLAARASESANPGNLRASLELWDRAIDLAPDVLVYYYHRAQVLSALKRVGDPAPVDECGVRAGRLAYQKCLARKIYANGLRAADQRPFNYLSRLTLADSELVLAPLTGDPTLGDAGTRHLQEFAEMIPHSWPARKLAAEVLIRTGQYGVALESLQEFSALTKNKVSPTVVIFLQGQAYRGLGQVEKSARSFELSLDLGLSGELAREAHQALAELYATLGKTGLAADHRKQYSELRQP